MSSNTARSRTLTADAAVLNRLAPKQKPKDKWAGWGPLFYVRATDCCGMQIFSNFWGYAHDEHCRAWAKPNDRVHKVSDLTPVRSDRDGYRVYPTYPVSGEECLEHDLIQQLTCPAWKDSSQIVAVLQQCQRALMGEVFEKVGFRCVVSKARSARTGHELSTFIKVLHPSAGGNHFLTDAK